MEHHMKLMDYLILTAGLKRQDMDRVEARLTLTARVIAAE
jgi:hypothetical protein